MSGAGVPSVLFDAADLNSGSCVSDSDEKLAVLPDSATFGSFALGFGGAQYAIKDFTSLSASRLRT